jgi:hypothetical protein
MTSLINRPIDLVLTCFFAISVLYGFLFSLPEGLGVPVAPDSPWPPLRVLYVYFTQTFLGPHPPPNTFYYLAFNLPWLIAPMVLGARVVFSRTSGPGERLG